MIRLNHLSKRLPACLLLLPGLAWAAPYYAVSKYAYVVQTGQGQLAANPGSPFLFDANCPTGGTLTPPGGAVDVLVSFPNDSDFEFQQIFTTSAALDATFPSGAYTITPLTGAAGTITLGGDAYPAPGQVQNAYWNANGQLQLDPSKPYTFQFSAFPGYATAGVLGQIHFTIDQQTPAISSFWYSTQSPAEPAGYTLPAGTLAAGGTYIGHLDYITYTVFDTTSVPGVDLFGSFGYTNQFVILAVAPPVSAPVVISQPSSATVSPGSTVLLSFAASGQPPPSYQWYFNGSSIGAAAGTLEILNASAANAGTYYCVATNSSGSVQSSSVTLGLNSTPDIGRLVNLSCRAQVGTGGNILIAGFAVGGGAGGATEPLLVRGSGPALAPFGVTGTLPDPKLQEFAGSVLQQTDDGWNGDATVASTAAQVHAFAWSATSLDSALLVSPGVGAYTAQISGSAGDTGVALAEVYDATPAGTYSAAKPRLVNLSARVQVGSGGNILIAGFVIGGSTARTVLIRASGPALIPFGVTGTLPDPQLQLYAGSTLLASNTGWGANSLLSSAFAAVSAFGWSPTSKDSAIFITLAPGAYTAQVSGAAGDTGVALVEVYEVP